MNDSPPSPSGTNPKKTTPAGPIQPFSGVSLKVNRTVHIITTSKGGAGKTLVAWNLVQYLQDKEQTVTGVDLDPMNHSLAEFKGLGAVKIIDLLEGPEGDFNGNAMDHMAEDMITAEAGENFVLDNGAAGFTGLTRYLSDNAFPALLRGYDGAMVVHAILAGGSASAQCLVALNSLLTAFDKGSGVQFMLWVNEHAGPFAVDGTWLEDMAIYKEMTADDRILGMIRLRRLPKAFLDDFERLQNMRLTYGEGLSSPKFLLMNRQRLTIIRRDIWSQLDSVLKV